MNETIYKLQSERLYYFANRTKCISCKHREDTPYILPSVKKGTINFSAKWVLHHQETHGIPNDLFRSWLTKALYQSNDGEEMLHKETYSSIYKEV